MDEDGTPERTALAGRYQLGPILGRGGMGIVRDGTDLRLGRSVAVKILRPELADQPRARRRFETEARAAARLAHPNVVTVFDSGEDAGVPFLVMERLPGRTLADDLATGSVQLERVRDIAREVLSALQAAHTAGIIHRDIKPGNVLLTSDGHVKVSDFGIAKTVDEADQTQTIELVATLAYLAPERLAGQPASARSDLYSVGVLLYEAVSGQRPFSAVTPLAEMRAIEIAQPPPLETLRPQVPDDLVAMIARAMSHDPADRFGSASEMADALTRAPDLAPTAPITASLAETVRIETPDVDASDVEDTVRVDQQQLTGTETAMLPVRPDDDAGHGAERSTRRFVLIAVAIIAFVIVLTAIAVGRRDNAHSALTPPVPTTRPVSGTAPTTIKLPAPLETSISKLEQDIAN